MKQLQTLYHTFMPWVDSNPIACWLVESVPPAVADMLMMTIFAEALLAMCVTSTGVNAEWYPVLAAR